MSKLILPSLEPRTVHPRPRTMGRRRRTPGRGLAPAAARPFLTAGRSDRRPADGVHHRWTVAERRYWREMFW
jgi:hypothetical protein